MTHALAMLALVVRDYDEAIAWYTGVLGFALVEDTPFPGTDKRWVVLAPDGDGDAADVGDAPIFTAARAAELLDRVALLVHQPLAKLSPQQRSILEGAAARPDALAGRKVLVVDDDVRNIFAMTSVLEKQEMVVLAAENGQDAIEMLQQTPDVDVVMMDVMMPGMDGYETMRAIRKMPELRALPIIAVTAKAMKGDREKTIEAGAWDYLSKPVEPDRMLAVLRAWLRP
jgi:CheY-like chemotaxis protein